MEEDWNVENLHIAFIVTDTETGFAHNANEVEVDVIPTGTERPEVLTNTMVFPNPAKDNTQLTFGLEEMKDINITIYNAIGQNVWQKAYGEMIGNQSLDLDVSNLTTGAYTLTIQVGTNDFVSKQIQVIK